MRISHFIAFYYSFGLCYLAKDKRRLWPIYKRAVFWQFIPSLTCQYPFKFFLNRNYQLRNQIVTENPVVSVIATIYQRLELGYSR